ncbi:F0F1 ATP synthase subunit B' [Roseospira marina]|uniref:ATP synthase subunit b n=1 Tax=Roseospira marina TaxID=140057 RepID=A0A5M6IE20_9PROT|nr:F0F1 ATP synthase subunit B' [Roseospira marina]KAA5606526.1 F0F1 ATP synthase subunit B' [Roseospira marina]MBB4314048.1 F-type H+-transporting ATPase subunit b [Roseospira marina]MBB5087209.1 F-type H+-transporting ATPase subunit b [Roseospira marina]
MPQFDPSSFPSQIFWLVVAFFVLYQLVVKLVMPSLGGVMESRQRTIDEDLAKAADLKARTDAAIESYEAALAEARGKAQALLRETNEELARAAEARNREVAEALGRRIEEGEARIAAARAEALDGVREAATDVAAALTAKLIGDGPDERTTRESVDAVMREAR